MCTPSDHNTPVITLKLLLTQRVWEDSDDDDDDDDDNDEEDNYSDDNEIIIIVVVIIIIIIIYKVLYNQQCSSVPLYIKQYVSGIKI